MVVNALPFDYHDFITQGGHSDFAAFVLLAALPVGLLALTLHHLGLARVLVVALAHKTTFEFGGLFEWSRPVSCYFHVSPSRANEGPALSAQPGPIGIDRPWTLAELTRHKPFSLTWDGSAEAAGNY